MDNRELVDFYLRVTNNAKECYSTAYISGGYKGFTILADLPIGGSQGSLTVRLSTEDDAFALVMNGDQVIDFTPPRTDRLRTRAMMLLTECCKNMDVGVPEQVRERVLEPIHKGIGVAS